MAVAISAAAMSTPVFANDPCATFMCMAGKLQGNNLLDDCDGPIHDYFSIVNHRHGHVDLSATAKSRLGFMKQCPGADGGKMNAINDVFGSST